MSISSLSDLANFRSTQAATVAVPDWGTDVVLREMDAEGMENFLSFYSDEGKFNMESVARVVALHLCDSDGNRLCDTESLDDIVAELKKHKHSVITALFNESLKVSGLTADEVAEEGKK